MLDLADNDKASFMIYSRDCFSFEGFASNVNILFLLFIWFCFSSLDDKNHQETRKREKHMEI